MIKIAEGTYSLANESGILKEYLTYCQLKSYRNDGCINKRDISTAAKFINKGDSTLRDHLTVLVQFGLVKRECHHYRLVSYDTAWEILGQDLSPNERKKRNGNFAIYKLPKEKLKEHIEFKEIELEVKRSALKAKKFILNNSESYSDTEIKRIKSCSLSDLHSVLDDLYVEQMSVEKGVKNCIENKLKANYCRAKGKDFNYTKITPYPTCRRIASILGYCDSIRTGRLVRERIEKAGLAKWESRRVNFCKTISFEGTKNVRELAYKYGPIKDNGAFGTVELISKFRVM